MNENPLFFACPNCGSSKIQDLSGYRSKSLKVCKKCAFIFDQRIPTIEELQNHYETYAYSARKQCPAATIASFNKLLDEFELWRDAGTILDVGCGQGDFLLAARARGWHVHGCEYSKAAVELCQAEGLHVITGALAGDLFSNLQFDIVTSFEVFEHINSGAEEIKLIFDKLKPGGLFYLTTPNFNALLRHVERDNFEMIAYPEHISFYTPKSIKKLSRAAGFKIRHVYTHGVAVGRLHALYLRKRQHNKIRETGQSWRLDTAELREATMRSKRLQLSKKFVNLLLNVFKLGDTLKVWLVKPNG